jgi:hypothetical protein
MAANAEYFTLEVNGNVIHQGLFDAARVPASTKATPAVKEEEIPEVIPVKPPAPPKAAAAPPTKPAVPPQAPAAPKPAAKTEEDDADAEWRGINLEFGPKTDDEPPDVNLDKTGDK